MKILDKIVEDKKIELKDLSSKIPVTLLEKRSLFSRQCISLKNSILNSPSGIICEFKRKSPSNNNINYETKIIDVVEGYQYAGAVEAKSIGSDAILLIASILESEEISKLSSLAKSLGLEVLVEIHSFDELKKISSNDIDVIGVNNRNLDTLEVDISNSEKLFDKIPDQFVKISESGISRVESILRLREIGYQGFLIGENFMKTSDPMISAYNFIKKVENEI